jgi:GNAT superfamily N-acetyltransferase
MPTSKNLDEIKDSLPSGNALTLRRVRPDDEEFLLALYGNTREEELAQVEWAEGQKDQFLRWQYQLQRSEYQTRFPDADYYIVLIDDQPAGRIWIGRDEQQIRLLDIALFPEFQNRGAGTLLLRHLMDEASVSRKPLRHMVFVLNPNAHRFYERLGFVVIDDLGAYKHMEWRTLQASD